MAYPNIYYGDPLMWHPQYGSPEVVKFVARGESLIRVMTESGQTRWASGDELVVLRRTGPIPYDLAYVE